MPEQEPCVELDEYAADAFVRWDKARRDLDEAQAIVDKARDLLRDFLTSHGVHVGTIGGQPVVRLVPETESHRLDADRLKDERPFIYQQYQREYTRRSYVRVIESSAR